MPVEEAYKILKATPGATWESIEQARRTLVNQLHPSRLKVLSAENRAQALAEAKRINTAYAALSQTRCNQH
jgi:curved DNA-binding protein CbpA